MGSEESKGLSQDALDDIRENTRFSGREIREWYDKFHEDYPSGSINEEQFVEMYAQMFPEGDASTFATHVFLAYDIDENGSIDFKEFMTTLSISSKGSVDDKLRWAYAMYDANGDGNVSREEATEIIHAIQKLKGINDKERAAEVAEQVFIVLDKDKNDVLCEQEFVLGAKGSSNIMSLLSA